MWHNEKAPTIIRFACTHLRSNNNVPHNIPLRFIHFTSYACVKVYWSNCMASTYLLGSRVRLELNKFREILLKINVKKKTNSINDGIFSVKVDDLVSIQRR